MLVLLSVTAYIPAIIGIHILLRAGFLQKAFAWGQGASVSLLTALFVIGITIWALVSAFSLRKMKETEKAAALQIESLRKEYEALLRKIERGRRYRHDMRNHFHVLERLLNEGKSEEGLKYIGALKGQLTELEQENCCENTMVNVVLCFYVRRAREENCRVAVKAEVLQACPVDEIDLCLILANGMENAIIACRNNERTADKWIRITVLTHGSGNVSVKIESPCGGSAKGRFEEPYGGLRTVKAVVKKYDGILQCEENDGVLGLRAVLFKPVDTRRGKKRGERHAADRNM